MDFNVDTDFPIFDHFLKSRPEVKIDELKKDIERYYLPYAQKLIELKNKKKNSNGLVVGVSAIQGAGKTTQGEILEVLLNHFGYPTDSLSIDDHYLTHKQLCQLREKDPRFIRRGVTHDIPLAKRDLKKLQTMEEGKPILISGYYKGANHGDGERFRWIRPEVGAVIKARVVDEELMVDKKMQKVKALQLINVSFKGHSVTLLDGMGSDVPLVEHLLPDFLNKFLSQQTEDVTITNLDPESVHFAGKGEVLVETKDLPNGWRVVTKKPAFIFYDGWMLGARKVEDESVFSSGLPALETPEAQQFAKDVNKKLSDYESLWQMLEFMTVLYVPNYKDSLIWRDQAEEHLRQKGEGMTHEQIQEFVYYFWRSVHPGIHIKNLAHDTKHTNQVVIINDDHSVKEVLTPDQVKEKYP